MSFCQKHLNHHCHHAHNCTNAEHLKLKREKDARAINNKSNGALKVQKIKDCQCQFMYDKRRKHDSNGSEQITKQLNLKQIQLKELHHNHLILQEKYDKTAQENKHIYTQIQYYREQFASLIENNSADSRNEIRKRLKETTDLTLKIKSLENQNLRLNNQNQSLRVLIHDTKSHQIHNKHLNYTLQEKYNLLHDKVLILNKQKEQYKVQLLNKIKERDGLMQKYDILKKELTNECNHYKKINKDSISQLQIVKKEFAKYKNGNQKQQEIFSIQRVKLQNKESILKNKLTQFQSENQKLQQLVNQLKQKCQTLEEDLLHAKRLFQKKGQLSRQCGELQQQLNNKFVESKTVIRQKHIYHEENKQNQQSQNQNELLRIQIISLKKTIAQLQQRNMKHFEEVIMNIGASQAFKRLVEEKNTVIKKLMKEKGQIYNKIINSQKI